VKSSFTDAFHVAGLVGVVLMAAVLVLAARATRETAAPAPVVDAEPESDLAELVA
jgi:hypothetical protein